MAEKFIKETLDDAEKFSYYEIIELYDDIREFLNKFKTFDTCPIVASIDERKDKDDKLIHVAFFSLDNILKSDIDLVRVMIKAMTDESSITLEELEASMETHMDNLIHDVEDVLSNTGEFMYYELGKTLEKLRFILSDFINHDLNPQQLTSKKKRLRELLGMLETCKKNNDILMKVVIICAYVATISELSL
uniref:Uncharacterized protein n=1 Tax=Pithovirus LCPAC403 TaxID=2506596 RepID=A0A481ZBE9_9VIRU|nr:MAG: hypothetical protein LCPAC403_01000 [Pithovirus LCPAC403]